MKSIEQLDFGDPTAEADIDVLFGANCFIETSSFKKVLELKRPIFFVGRRGSGKSAISLAIERIFSEASRTQCVSLRPQSFLFAHVKSLATLITKSSGVNWEFLFTSVWSATLSLAVARKLLAYYRIRETPGRDLATLKQFVEDMDRKEWPIQPERSITWSLRQVVDVLSNPGADPVGEINEALSVLRADEISKSIRKLRDSADLQIVTIIDGLDENWDGSNTSAHLLSGLLVQAAQHYAATGCVTFAFIRENMYRRIRALSQRWDRIEGYFHQLHWSEPEIKILISRRLDASLGKKNVEWNSVFSGTVDGTDSLTFLIRRTQFKPREIILFCRYCVEESQRRAGNRVSEEDIRNAEFRYSENRLSDLVNEYEDAVPGLDRILSLFRGKPQAIPASEMIEFLSEYIRCGRYAEQAPKLSLTHPSAGTILDVLLGIGFLGVKLLDSPDTVFKYYGEEGSAFANLDQVEEFVIHPAFAAALRLISLKSGRRLREANDTNLVVASAIMSARQSEASEAGSILLAQLDEIEPGLGAFGDYEKLVLEILTFAFRGFLDNAKTQERNWAGTQIRDIVFDNTGETSFFATLRDRHNAITVTFECKNKKQLEPADFHQAETRLNESTGLFAFICYRSDRREPVRCEVEQLRDIHRKDSRKMVMLLSDANLRQIVERRLRGTLDRFLSKRYSLYLRLYLS